MTEPKSDDEDDRIDKVRAEIEATRSDAAYQQIVVERYRAQLLGELGQEAWGCYDRHRDGSDVYLTESISALEEARSTLTTEPFVAWWLATSLSERFLRSGNCADLDRVISLYAEVAEAPDTDAEDAGLARFRLAGWVYERGEPGDLDRSIAEFERALALSVDDGGDPLPWHIDVLETAGRVYAERFRRDQHSADADSTITHWTAFLNDAPPDAEIDPAVPLDLATMLQNRSVGPPVDLGDLVRARAAIDRTLALVADGHPLRCRTLLVATSIGWIGYQESRSLEELNSVTDMVAAAAKIGGDTDEEQTLDALRGLIIAERVILGLPTDPSDTEVMQRAGRLIGPPDAAGDVNGLLGNLMSGQVTGEWVSERRADIRKRYASCDVTDPARPYWAIMLIVLELRAVELLHAPVDMPALTVLLDVAQTIKNTNAQLGPLIDMMRAQLVLLDAATSGDNRKVAAALQILQDNRGVLDADTDLQKLLDLTIVAGPHMGAPTDVSFAGADDVTVARCVAGAADRGWAAYIADDRDAMHAALAELREIMAGPGSEIVHKLAVMNSLPLSQLLEPLAASARNERAQAFFRTTAALARAAVAFILSDEFGSARALAAAEQILAGLPDTDLETLQLRVQLAGAYMSRMETFRTFDDADTVIRQLEPLLPHLRPHQAELSQAQECLSGAYGIRNERGASVDIALEALRGYAWRVLIASGPDAAAQAARGAVGIAREVASQCVTDDRPDLAVRALDSCRGLMLLAATASRDVPGQLAAAGFADLAHEWATAADGSGLVPADIRLRAMDVLLGGEKPLSRLITPPAPAEIREALSSQSADALIYLAPMEADHVPVAVIVPAKGEPVILRLSVVAQRFSALEKYLASRLSGRTRDAIVQDVPPDTGSTDDTAVLAALADWSWHAAMREVISWCSRSGLASPKLVLIPMAEFGLVPWHAARAPGGRYVIQDATISYATSARLFCENAARSPMPFDGASLIVGDPAGNLPHAGAEAMAIHEVLYQEATYLGSDPSAAGAGTSDQVLEWLREALTEGCGVLHLACHGQVDPHGAETSYLELHGREHLAAERLVELSRNNADGYRIGAVVLAACSTGLSGRAYDEAFSLASAFGMSGARSVVGSLWSVPDDATSLLMYMFHHNLRACGLGAAEALRRAQLWMLDERRVPPQTMPAALRDRAKDPALAAMVGWAGFTHAGRW